MRKKEELTKKQQRILAVLAISIMIIIMGLLMWVIGRPLVRFASEPELFREWIESYGIWGPGIYMGCVILQVLVAFIPGEPLELVAGYAFGTLQGSLLCLAASTIGSVLVFGLVRRYGMKLVEVFYSAEKLHELRFLICSVGRIPAMITSTVSGDALGSESYLPAIIILTVTLIISGIGLLIYRHICKKNNREPMEYLKTKMRERNEKREKEE